MSDNFQFISITVGESGNIDRIHGRTTLNFGVQHIHMSDFASRKEKEAIVYSLVLDGCICSACFRVDRQGVIARIEQRKNRGGEITQRRRILSQFNWALRGKINHVFSGFCSDNGSSLSDVVFQVDKDLEQTFQQTGLITGLTSKAHELADIVGWANHANVRIENVGEYDFVNDIEQYVLNRVLRRK